MENIIYNELRSRGYFVDVGVVDRLFFTYLTWNVRMKKQSGKEIRVRNKTISEVLFVKVDMWRKNGTVF